MTSHFNNVTRIGGEECDASQRNIQNSHAATYMLDNFHQECLMKDAINIATAQPTVNYTGSHQTGIGGCNINENTQLSRSVPPKPKCRITLQERPFLTVPYLGRGESHPELESKLQQGENESNKKSVNPFSEICYAPYSETPMLPSLKANITNPANLVESSASNGWVRGGVPSRELSRDSQCYTQDK